MWYADEILTNPNLAASLYAWAPKKDSQGNEHKSDSPNRILQGWVNDDFSLSASHKWTTGGSVIEEIVRDAVKLRNSGRQTINKLSQVLETLFDVKGDMWTDQQKVEVSSSEWFKQYSGTDVSVPDLTFNAIFINDSDNGKDAGDEVKSVLPYFLPSTFDVDLKGLAAQLTPPCGYVMPKFTSASEGTKNQSATKAIDWTKGRWKIALAASESEVDNSIIKQIDWLLLDSVDVKRSRENVFVNGKIKPYYYQLTLKFEIGVPLFNSDILDMI